MGLFDLFFEEIPDDEQENVTEEERETPVESQTDEPKRELTEEEKRIIELGRAQQEFKTRYKTKVLSHSLISLGLTVVIFIASLMVILSIITRVYKVEGNGMSPTIAENEYIMVNKLAYKMRLPERGDIICANNHIYRVIGLPGETIKIYAGHIYIDGKIAEESYINDNAGTYDFGNGTPEVELSGYFVLNDNRTCFDDSRSGVIIQLDDIEGKVAAY